MTSAKNQELSWTIRDSHYGIRYLWPGSTKRPELLVVLVHGIRGDASNSWQGWPEKLAKAVSEKLSKTGRDHSHETTASFDIFCFAFAARMTQRASIEDAVRDFRKVLTSDFKDYRHLFFVTHSTGGLVVKQAINEDIQEVYESYFEQAGPWRSDYAKTYRFFQESLTARCREVINISVPHSGGAFLVSLAGILGYHLLSPFFWIWGWLDDIVRPRLQKEKHLRYRDGFPAGYNRIPYQLRWKSSTLKRWETTYRQLCLVIDQRRLPRPISREINGIDDTVIDPTELPADQIDPQRRRPETGRISKLRGGHTSVKEASIPSVADRIVHVSLMPSRSICFITLARTLMMDGPAFLVGLDLETNLVTDIQEISAKSSDTEAESTDDCSGD